MTHTDTTIALLRTIWERPDDDTARLLYADALDDAATTVPCKCMTHEYPVDRRVPCYTCSGTGTVSDGNRERAEFIRVQVELARLHDAGHGAGATKDCPVSVAYRADKRPGGQTMPRCRICDDALDAEQRSAELLAAHGREWARVPWRGIDAFDANPTPGGGPLGQRATPHWHREFIGRVEVPALSWVMEFVPPKWSEPPNWRVTDWALAVARTHPVIEWVIGDREPWRAADNNRLWWWVDADRDSPVAGVPESCQIPRPLLRAIPERHRSPSNRRAEFDTREAARHALALAAGDVVREAVRATEGRT